MKKSIKIISISIITILIIISLMCLIINILIDNKKNKNDIKNEKIFCEIKYLDYEILSMISLLDNSVIPDEWVKLYNNTEKLYSYWNSVILDLNLLNINKYELTDFGKILDKLVFSIKNQNQTDCLNNLSLLYQKILTYYTSLEGKNYSIYINVSQAKYNLVQAYLMAPSRSWTSVYEYILKSEEYCINLVNILEKSKYNQYNINQTYIAVKELENIIDIQDLDIFYIKYNIAIKNLQNI